jgi:hypothetical protein
MIRSGSVRVALAAVAVVLALGVLRFKPWRLLTGEGTPPSERAQLSVGFLPVT